jgi:hypothetical protein
MSGQPTVVFEGNPADLPSTPAHDGEQGDLFGWSESKEDELLEEERPSGMPMRAHHAPSEVKAGLFKQRALDAARREGLMASEDPTCWRPRCTCPARHAP